MTGESMKQSNQANSETSAKPVEPGKDHAPNGVDVLRFHPPITLRAMSVEALQALYEYVPTDRQDYYRKVYDERLVAQGAKGSDEHEYAVADALLRQYEELRLVPTGTKWARPSSETQAAVENGTIFDLPESLYEKTRSRTEGAPSPIVVAGLLLIGVVLFFTMFLGPMIGGSGGKIIFTPSTKTPTPSLTPVRSPTPTPLALENQDPIISSGDYNSSVAIYPVSLNVLVTDARQPRVFVVQRRQIKVSEWTYQDNPDTASMLAGLVVRPVIGIPWSEENALLFDAMHPGTKITLRMNTGTILRFDYVDSKNVQRSDTSIFNQTGPGLILILIGEHDKESGSPTAYRLAVTASYSSRQELTVENVISDGMLEPVAVATSTPTLTPTPVRRITLQMISVTTNNGVLNLKVRVINDRAEPLVVKPDMVWIVYGYAPTPLEPRIPSEGLVPFNVLPGQAVDMDIYFKYNGEPFATFGLGDDAEYRFGIQLRK